MKALVYDHFGGPEVYHFSDVPTPEPGEGEVQIRVDGAAVNPVDWKIREGKYPAASPKQFPAVPLRDFSGEVTKIGKGVTGFQPGESVYGITNHGSAAEFTVAKASEIGPRPTSLDPAEAATVPLAAMTAWQALFDHGHLQKGERVFIHAGAGGVGTFAIQLAKWRGAHVISSASKRNLGLLTQLGADEVIDYQSQKFEDVVTDVDLVLHSIGPDALEGSLKILKKGGRLIAISAQPDEAEAKSQGKEAIRFSMKPSTSNLEELAKLIDSGKVRPVVETVVPLDQSVFAIKSSQEGHTVGKIGIRVR